jgi:DNA-binding transcriptional LysR family regulator
MELIDTKVLRYFLTVVRIGSIRGAAEHLNVAPSVVSRQISDAEYQIGLPLFERTARGVSLTDAGRLVLEHGKRVVEDHGLLAEQLSQLKGAQQGRVRICCGEGFVADLLEHGLRSFSKVYPNICYDISLAGTDAVLDAIINGDSDIGIVYNPVIDTRIRSVAIQRQSLYLMAPPDHPLAGREDVSLRECLDSPYALLWKSHGVRQLVGRVAADSGLALTPLVESGSIDVLRRFVTSGLGVTFLPKFSALTEVSRREAVCVPLTDVLLIQASAHLIVRAQRRLPMSVERLASSLSQEMNAFRNTP